MSFDLGVFGKANNPYQITELYIMACKGKISQIKEDENVKFFIKEISQMYPYLERVDDEKIKNCPWTCEFDMSDKHWIGNISFSFVDEIYPNVLELVKKHKLYLYNPQNNEVINL